MEGSSDYSTASTGRFPGVPSTTRTSLSGERTIRSSYTIDSQAVPRTYQGYSESKFPCVYPDCIGDHRLAEWIGHMRTHISPLNRDDRTYSCATTYNCPCNSEHPSWSHLLSQELATFSLRGGVFSSELLRVLGIDEGIRLPYAGGGEQSRFTAPWARGGFDTRLTPHFGGQMYPNQGRDRDPWDNASGISSCRLTVVKVLLGAVTYPTTSKTIRMTMVDIISCVGSLAWRIHQLVGNIRCFLWVQRINIRSARKSARLHPDLMVIFFSLLFSLLVLCSLCNVPSSWFLFFLTDGCMFLHGTTGLFGGLVFR